MNEQVEAWHVYWDEYQRVRGVPEGDILREGCESQVRMGALANGSNYGEIWLHHVVECFNSTRNKAKEGRYGLIRREAWIPH